VTRDFGDRAGTKRSRSLATESRFGRGGQAATQGPSEKPVAQCGALRWGIERGLGCVKALQNPLTLHGLARTNLQHGHSQLNSAPSLYSHRISRRRSLDLFGIANLAAYGNDAWARNDLRDLVPIHTAHWIAGFFSGAVITNRVYEHG
jgi:hypothetical protein